MSGFPQVLVASSSPESYEILTRALAQCGLEPICTETVSEAQTEMARKHFGMVFCQPRLNDGSFRDIIRTAESGKSKVPVVVWSDFYDRDLYIEAMGLGAFDYIAYPYRHQEVEWVVRNAMYNAAA